MDKYQTIREDLEMFMSLADAFLDEELANPVVEPINTKKLYEAIDLSLSKQPILDTDLKKSLQGLITKTPKTASNLFFNQLFGGRQSKAMLGDLLAVLINSSMYTYKVAGAQVGVEKEIIQQVCKIIGYDSDASGTFPTGGSMSNYMAFLMARDAHNANIKFDGVREQLVAYTSAVSHYSIAKNASFAGVGRNNIRYIATNEKGEMLPEALATQIEKDITEGFKPFFINATAGTTVLGAFDPILALSVISNKYNLWLHVDGAYSGGVIFSDKYKSLVEGIEYSDSFSFNAHKMLGTPLTCSILVTRHKQQLIDSFSNEADYLYQTDDDEYNLGKTSLQCGRRNDALKFWTLWKSVGTIGLSKMVEQQFYLADIARDYVRKHPDYTLYSYDNSISICFNYKDFDANELSKGLYETGSTLVAYGFFEKQQFIRLVTINANNTKEDILNFFKVLENYAAQHKNQIKKVAYI